MEKDVQELKMLQKNLGNPFLALQAQEPAAG